MPKDFQKVDDVEVISTTELFQDIINRACPEVRTEIAETNTNPIIYL